MSEVKEENGEVAEKREWKGILSVAFLGSALVIGLILKADTTILSGIVVALGAAIGVASKIA